MTPAARGALGATLIALAACSARMPAEAPVQLLDLAREVPVVVVSEPPAAQVYVLGDDRMFAARGPTPAVIDRLVIHKQRFKHGQRQPPPAADPALLLIDRQPSHGPPTVAARGETLRFDVMVVTADGTAHRTSFDLAPDDLARSFTDGRIELEFVPPARAGTP